MSGHGPVPRNAEKLLSLLRQDIETTALEPRSELRELGVHLVESQDSPPAPPIDLAGSLQRLQDAQFKLQAEIEGFANPPPSPATLRGQIGLTLIRAIDRLTWWQATKFRDFMRVVSGVIQAQTASMEALAEQQREKQLSIEEIRSSLREVLIDLSRFAVLLRTHETVIASLPDSCLRQLASLQAQLNEERQRSASLEHQFQIEQKRIAALFDEIERLGPKQS